MQDWVSYTDTHPQHTVVGELLVKPEVYSPQLNNSRHILVWLPPNYHQTDTHYPVLYMHDGDNLFDAYASFAGEWNVDETLVSLDIDAIVVGIPNMGTERIKEYNPFRGHRRWQSKGDDYIAFIADTVKPMIDADFRTLPDPIHTGIIGSSMGGLISLHGYLSRADVFGLCGAMSPVTWMGRQALNRRILENASGQGRVYLDIGTREGESYAKQSPKQPISKSSKYYRDGVRELRASFQQKGYYDNLKYVEEENALHNEDAWSRRFPEAVQFLLR